MRLVFLSDTHGRRPLKHAVPAGDILVHAGDLTMRGDMREIPQEAYWLGSLKKELGFKAVVVIPGNHDWLAERDPALMREVMKENGLVYLQHQSAAVEGLRFFGSGYTPRFYDWALNVDRGEKLARLWAQIPDDTQVLVTHGPPWGQLDGVPMRDDDGYRSGLMEHAGCQDLSERIKSLKDLKVHAFGHIHRPGMVVENGVTYINASTCNEGYDAVHAPQVLELP